MYKEKYNFTGMKSVLKILVILILLVYSQSIFAQGGWIKPNNSYGVISNRTSTQIFQAIPTSDTVPTTLPAYDLGQAGLQWCKGNHTLYVWKPELTSWLAYTTGSGSTNSNLGSGFRIAVAGTNNIKTLFPGIGLKIDSTSNANALTPSLDTAYTNLLYSSTTTDGTTNDFTVINVLNTPPVSPATGDQYRIGTAPTGAWVGHANAIATWNGTSWDFTAPGANDYVYQTADKKTYQFKSSDNLWHASGGVAIVNNLQTITNGMKIGLSNNKPFSIATNNITRFNLSNSGYPSFYYLNNGAAGTDSFVVWHNGELRRIAASTYLQSFTETDPLYTANGYPKSGGNLTAGAYIGYPTINYPSSPSSGFVDFGFNTSNNLFYKNSSGYLRIFKNRFPGDDSTYYPYKAVSTLADSSDVFSAIALKENALGNPASNGYVLSSTMGGVRSWVPTSGGSGWGLTGNSATTSGSNFIGTTDNQSLSFKTNNARKMLLDSLGRLHLNDSLYYPVSLNIYNRDSAIIRLASQGDNISGIYFYEQENNSSAINKYGAYLKYDAFNNNLNIIGINNGVRTTIISIPVQSGTAGNISISGSVAVSAGATFGGSTAVTGTLSSTSRYSIGSDLGLHPVGGGQSIVQTWHGLQLSGSTQTVPSSYSPANVGIGADAYHVVIPMVQASQAGLAILGISGQTGNYFEVTTNANKTSTHGDVFAITSAKELKIWRPLFTNGSTPSYSLGTGAGTSPTASITGNDISGYVTINTGTTPANGDIITITFATTLTNTPTSIILTPANDNAIDVKVGADQASASTTSFKIRSSPTTALTPSTTYKFYYHITQ